MHQQIGMGWKLDQPWLVTDQSVWDIQFVPVKFTRRIVHVSHQSMWLEWNHETFRTLLSFTPQL